MNTPEWLKPGVYGALIGAAFVGIVGFSWGGWVTGGTSNDRAMAMSRDNVVASMVPGSLDLPEARRSHDSRLGDDARNRCPGPRHCSSLPEGTGTLRSCCSEPTM